MNFRLLAILSVVGSLISCEPDTSSVSKDEGTGNQVIAALDKYKAERGSYPDTLGALEPDYMPSITPPKYGERRWDYVHYCRNDSFGLSMWGRRPTDKGYVYSSERRQWEVADNSF